MVIIICVCLLALMLFIAFVKCIHLLLTLGLLGSTIVCLILAGSNKIPADFITRLNRTMLWLAAFAVLTGTLLIYPKHFTFHTPWIQAAYLLVFVFGTAVSLLVYWRNQLTSRWGWIVSYVILSGTLIAIVHDAVTKTTFLL